MILRYLFLILSLNPASALFFCSLSLGVIIRISSASWFTAWLGLELNLLSFIPLISSTRNLYSSEAALKYFLVQALGSAVFLCRSSTVLISSKPVLSFFILVSLLLKIGAAPFYFWLPPIIQGLSWFNCLVLITIQKIAPIILISYLIQTNSNLISLLYLSSVLSACAGSLGGLNQVFLRKILAYSSIAHIRWILASLVNRTLLWLNYFLIYCIVSISAVWPLYLHQIFHFNQLISTPFHLNLSRLRISVAFLSLGGLPPFIGFLPKILVVQFLSQQGIILWVAILFLGALITLFFYIRVILIALSLNNPKLKWVKKNYEKFNRSLVILTGLNFGLFFIPIF